MTAVTTATNSDLMSGMRGIARRNEKAAKNLWPLVERHPWQPQRRSVTEINHRYPIFNTEKHSLISEEEREAVCKGSSQAPGSAVGWQCGGIWARPQLKAWTSFPPFWSSGIKPCFLKILSLTVTVGLSYSYKLHCAAMCRKKLFT